MTLYQIRVYTYSMKRIKLQDHLSVAELEQRYRNATDVVARSQWQIVWLLAQGHTPAAVAELTAYSTNWIYALLRRYNADGPTGVGDRRHRNPGQARLLSSALRCDLEQALEGPAPDGGLWTGPKVATWMSEKLGRPIHPQRGNEALQQLEYRSYMPRPRHLKVDAAAQDAFKKRRYPML